MQGGCQCGKVRFHIESQPIVVYTCHCTDCQQQSSSAFGISVWVSVQSFILDKGQLKFWTTLSESGNSKQCSFCGDCGSRIYHAFNDDSDVFSIKGGTLDDARHLQPIGHIWLRSSPKWIANQFSGEFCFSKEPESFDGMVKAYNQSNTID